MVSVWHDYRSRAEEINIYFKFLETNTFTNDDVFKIMKANGFLMLYNLIESTVRNALEEIHDSLTSQNLKYDDCIDEIKTIWIDFKYKKFKEKSAKSILSHINSIGEDVISINYRLYISKLKSNDISGNLDRQKIDLLAEKYKFKKNFRIGGSELHAIKLRRNSLAHGEESFINVGKNYHINEMIKLKKISLIYLKEMLIHIDHYTTQKQFKI